LVLHLVFYQLQTIYHLYFFRPYSMSNADDISQERVSQLQTDNATQRAHIQLLTERLTNREARGEHASDLRLHAADLRAQVEATKAAADSALHELRLQHTREAELLQRVVESMQAQLRDKDQMVAQLVRRLADKDEMVALLTRQLTEKDGQLHALLQAASGDVQAESRALRVERDAAVAARDAAVSEKKVQVAALTATLAERDRAIGAHRAAPVAGSVVAADNFHVGARVTNYSLFSKARHGVIHSIEAGQLAIGRWDQGDVMRVRVPDPNFAYSQVACQEPL
jgi:predicted phage tail protein